MKILRNRSGHHAAHAERGAALLLSLLILLVLVAIVIQLNVSTGTDARMARNDVTLTMMDLAAESAILQELETLKTDAESDSSGGGDAAGAASGAATPPAPTPAAGAGAPAAGGQPAASDSRRDEWASPQRTEINEIKLRIVVVDEDCKYNVLNMLNPDQKEADAAFDRVVRILDLCRDGTDFDIDQTTAEDMAKAMREFMTKRKQSKLPRPKLLTDLPKNEDQGLPLSMRDFMPLEPFEDHHFKDFRDSNGLVVHSITSFLTVWTSIGSAPSAASASATGGTAGTGNGSTATNGSNSTNGQTSTNGKSTPDTSQASNQTPAGNTGSGSTANTGQNASANGASGASGASGSGAGATVGGYGVNVNTAPVAVLHGLFDSRDVPSRFFDKLVEWRNLEDEDEKEKDKQQQAESSTTPPEVQLDEYGEPILKRNFFDSIQKLSDIDGYTDLPAEMQAKLNQLLTTQSNVFSIYVVARKSTSVDTSAELGLTPAEQRKHEETGGDTLLRVVHAVYWRHKDGQDITMTPIVRWEVLDYLPYEVLDFPPDDR